NRPTSPAWRKPRSLACATSRANLIDQRFPSRGGGGEPSKVGRNAEMKQQDDANKGAENLYAKYKGAPLPQDTEDGLREGYLARDGNPTTGQMTIQAYNEMSETGHKSFKDKTPRMSWR
ncbi:hypothetical protein, partial [Ralstonia pseudosolanacearum]|uniref:hypothetical protein n=2 Tax=Ralstonia pseudosolanacearum TaxID=1310165 RepID=UPI001FF91157